MAVAITPFNPQTWNRYAYVANNPLNNVDPLGLVLGPPPPPQPPPPAPASLYDIWGNAWQVIAGIFRFQYQVEPPDRAAVENTGYKISVDVSSTFQNSKFKLTSPFADRNDACPGSSLTFSADGAFAFGAGGNASVTIGVNSTGISVARGYGATVGTPQAGITWQVGWIDLSHTTGMVDFSLNAGPGKRLAASIPWGKGLDGNHMPTGIQFGGGFGGNWPRAFGAMYEDQTTGYQNFCVTWGDILGNE